VLQLMLTVAIQYSGSAECSEHGQKRSGLMFSQHVTSCRWVGGFRRFEGTCCRHQESRGPRRLCSTVKVKTLWSFETSGTTHPTTVKRDFCLP